MTNREFFEAIINGEISEEIVAKAKEELVKLDARNSKRAEAKATKREVEYAPIEDAILKALEGTMTTSEIAKATGLTTNKVSPRCKVLVEKGILTESEVKVKGSGVRKAYTLAQSPRESKDSHFFMEIVQT